MPFVPPIPFPQPPTFAGLSDAEIAELEGRERHAVEARVQVLRNISVLLDAAVLQFQQYMSIAAQYPTQPVGAAQPTPSAEGPAVPTGANGLGSSSQEPGPSSSTSTAAEPKTESSASGSGSPPSDPVADEIRRRRLAKFSDGDQAGPSTSSASASASTSSEEKKE